MTWFLKRGTKLFILADFFLLGERELNRLESNMLHAVCSLCSISTYLPLVLHRSNYMKSRTDARTEKAKILNRLALLVACSFCSFMNSIVREWSCSDATMHWTPECEQFTDAVNSWYIERKWSNLHLFSHSSLLLWLWFQSFIVTVLDR